MWKLNNIRIFVQEKEENSPQKVIAVLQPLNGNSVYHLLGTKRSIYQIKGKIVGDVDKQAIAALAQSGSNVTLSGYGRHFGNFLINSAQFAEEQTICQSIRPDLPETAPVYTFTLELLENG